MFKWFKRNTQKTEGPFEPLTVEDLMGEEDEAHAEEAVTTVVPRIETLTQGDIENVVERLDVERIRRTMMLFDVRWLRDDGVSYIPTEVDIVREACLLAADTVIGRRKYGRFFTLCRKSFCARAFLTDTNYEVLQMEYRLAEASSAPQ